MRKMKQKNKHGQTWSVDLIVGVVVFMLVIVILYAILSTDPGEEQALRQEADVVHAKLNAETSDPGIEHLVSGQRIDTIGMQQIYNMDYDELKSLLGVQGDFCIVVVNDDNRIIPVHDGTRYYLSAGSDQHDLFITDTGLLCGESRP